MHGYKFGRTGSGANASPLLFFPVLNAAASYYEILRDNSDYRKLYFGQIVSLLGDWFNYIAVQTLVFELTKSGLAAGLAIITSSLPAFV